MNILGIMLTGGESTHSTTLDRESDTEFTYIGTESDVPCGLMTNQVNTSDPGGTTLTCTTDIHGLSTGQSTTDISEECIMLKESLCILSIGLTGEIGGVSEEK